jgi:hypothetical protein
MPSRNATPLDSTQKSFWLGRLFRTASLKPVMTDDRHGRRFFVRNAA